jgi:hypothetical protein
MGGLMKYGVEIGSGVMTYTPSLIKIGSGIQKLIGRDSQTDSMVTSQAYFFFFFKIRKVG